MRVLVVDNYDSFVFNLVQYLGQLGVHADVWRNDDDGREFAMYGQYREIDRPERLVHTEIFNESESLVTSVLTQKAGITTLTMTVQYESKEVRDQALESGMADGVAVSYKRLEEILES